MTPAPDRHKGLSRDEAARRLAVDGPNELPRPPQRTTARIAREIAAEPMFQLLAAAVALYLLLGDLGEACVLLAFLVVIVVIDLVQERRTERVLEALRDMTSPRALVWRDGQPVRVAGTEVVCGDWLVLTEGDRVAADARLIEANDLALDESLLTGESLPVERRADGDTLVHAGTMVVSGQGLAEVVATGARSEIGRIGVDLGRIEPEATPLHRQTRQLVRWFSVLGLGLSVAVAVLMGWIYRDWVQGVLAGIALAMSMLPQEFLLILTVFMAMGAWRLSQHRVLTRRPATIEALGAATVLCTDKTGTLTHNRMAIDTLVPGLDGASGRWRPASAQPLSPAGVALVQVGVRACEVEPFDPMERAFHALAAQVLAPQPARELVHEYPLAPGWPVMTHVWATDTPGRFDVAAKGAPETVARLCGLQADALQAVLSEAESLAAQGMRLLGVARARAVGTEWPASPEGFAFEWLGLVALADPLRDTVPGAVRDCRRAGIRVVMITGDHPATARAIALQAGLDGERGCLLGTEVEALTDAELRERVPHVSVFARVAPQHKLRIVEALKARGEVVAMTGDGVNDAPSLKAAHIGIAMGGRGTDVAREASALVLLDDDFSTLVKAVRLGRRIDDNLRKAMRFVLAVHVPIAGLTLLPLLGGWPLLFTPMHIAFLEIVIDPVCSMAFEAEPEEPDVMDRPPRDPHAPLFSLGLIASSLGQGAGILAAVALFYIGVLGTGVATDAARAAAFVVLVAANIGLILSSRSRGAGWRQTFQGNRLLWGMIAATVALLALVVGWGPLRSLFGFAWPGWPLLGAAAGVGLAVLLVLQAVKVLWRVCLPARRSA